MPGKTGPIAVLTILAAGIGAVILGGGDPALGPGPLLSVDPLAEVNYADRMAITKFEEAVKVAGLNIDVETATVEETLKDGRAIRVQDGDGNLDPATHCVMLLDAPARRDTNIPDVPDVVGSISILSRASPTLLDDSCEKETNSCVWMVMLWGENCKLFADSIHYLGSNMTQLLKHDDKVRGRYLRTDGECENKDGKKYACTVAINDKNAMPGRPWFEPAAFAGRDGDLNFGQAKNEKAVGRYKIDEETGKVKEINPNAEDGKFVPVKTEPTEPVEPVEPIIEP